MIWYLLLFIIVFLKICFGKMKSYKKKRAFLLISGILIILVMGCRYADVSLRGDLNNYYRMFQSTFDVAWQDIFTTFSYMEPGYVLLNKVLTVFFPWQQSIIFIEALICVYFVSRFILKFDVDPFVGILVYLAQGIWIFQLTGFRQAIAISLCMFSLEFVQQQKFGKFAVITLIAMTFHYTAIVFAVFYFASKIKIKKTSIFIYILITAILFISSDRLLQLGSEMTGTDYNTAATWGNLLGPTINIMFYILILYLLYVYKEKEDKKILLYWNMTLIGLIVYCMRFISLPFERISFYFLWGSIAALPYGITLIHNARVRSMLKYGVILALIVLYVYRITSTVGLEYRFFWK